MNIHNSPENRESIEGTPSKTKNIVSHMRNIALSVALAVGASNAQSQEINVNIDATKYISQDLITFLAQRNVPLKSLA